MASACGERTEGEVEVARLLGDETTTVTIDDVDGHLISLLDTLPTFDDQIAKSATLYAQATKGTGHVSVSPAVAEARAAVARACVAALSLFLDGSMGEPPAGSTHAQRFAQYLTKSPAALAAARAPSAFVVPQSYLSMLWRQAEAGGALEQALRATVGHVRSTIEGIVDSGFFDERVLAACKAGAQLTFAAAAVDPPSLRGVVWPLPDVQTKLSPTPTMGAEISRNSLFAAIFSPTIIAVGDARDRRSAMALASGRRYFLRASDPTAAEIEEHLTGTLAGNDEELLMTATDRQAAEEVRTLQRSLRGASTRALAALLRVTAVDDAGASYHPLVNWLWLVAEANAGNARTARNTQGLATEGWLTNLSVAACRATTGFASKATIEPWTSAHCWPGGPIAASAIVASAARLGMPASDPDSLWVDGELAARVAGTPGSPLNSYSLGTLLLATASLQHIGPVQTLERYKDGVNQLSMTLHELRDFIAGNDDVHVLGADQRAAMRSRIRQLVTKLVPALRPLATSLVEKEDWVDRLRFCGVVSRWVLAMGDFVPWDCAAMDDGASERHDPRDLKALPAFVVEDVATLVTYAVRFCPASLDDDRSADSLDAIAQLLGHGLAGVDHFSSHVRSTLSKAAFSLSEASPGRTVLKRHATLFSVALDSFIVERAGTDKEKNWTVRRDALRLASLLLVQPVSTRLAQCLLADIAWLTDEAFAAAAEAKATCDEWTAAGRPVPAQPTALGVDQSLRKVARRAELLASFAVSALECLQALVPQSVPVLVGDDAVRDRTVTLLNSLTLRAGSPSAPAEIASGRWFSVEPLLVAVGRIFAALYEGASAAGAVGANRLVVTASRAGSGFYSPEGYATVASLMSGSEADTFKAYAAAVATAAADTALVRDAYLDDDLAEQAPDEYVDPFVATLMRDPVRLPSSGAVCDRSSIERHLAVEGRDPFNREPLTIDQVEPLPALREAIAAWIVTKGGTVPPSDSANDACFTVNHRVSVYRHVPGENGVVDGRTGANRRAGTEDGVGDGHVGPNSHPVQQDAVDNASASVDGAPGPKHALLHRAHGADARVGADDRLGANRRLWVNGRARRDVRLTLLATGRFGRRVPREVWRHTSQVPRCLRKGRDGRHLDEVRLGNDGSDEGHLVAPEAEQAGGTARRLGPHDERHHVQREGPQRHSLPLPCTLKQAKDAHGKDVDVRVDVGSAHVEFGKGAQDRLANRQVSAAPSVHRAPQHHARRSAAGQPGNEGRKAVVARPLVVHWLGLAGQGTAGNSGWVGRWLLGQLPKADGEAGL
eukprot:CAMPEP_0170756984 /NCGR_PEP_ID=MMETSP0437-20130122/14301_1 /TAXON_ID=0 /ORGANISM="Sexangularia sp." /LENGTH=1290 /DNA_ID=CAMNT_0011096173 /DNA_START=349 /DNA_END=4222 /DNA_ORIENTATION=+